jgi:aspartyl/asparaginyl beta-hydroxylase (cupin superfamily)
MGDPGTAGPGGAAIVGGGYALGEASRWMFDVPTARPLDSLRLLRRSVVKKQGKRLFRRINRFFAAQSLVPDAPYLEASLFPWLAELEANWREVRDELAVLLKDRDALPRFQDISPDQMRISPDDLWRTFVLFGFGYRSDRNCDACPKTTALLQNVPGLENAFFSILAPGKYIPSHRGITKALLRVHLPVMLPRDRHRCTMTVGGIQCAWEEGRALVFDDTYPHEVLNDTGEERAVLLFDFWRPMRRPGRAMSRLLFSLFRRTGYVQEARRNQTAWERRYWDSRR